MYVCMYIYIYIYIVYMYIHIACAAPCGPAACRRGPPHTHDIFSEFRTRW